MASERTLSAQAGPTARTARIILMSMLLWTLTSGSTFADSLKNPANAKPTKAALLAVPLSFEANQGQTGSQVEFLSRGDGYALFLTSNEAVFTLRTPAGVKAPPSVFRMELLGAESNAQVSGADRLPGVANYYIGNDPKNWRDGIAVYSKVKYQGIYPGVDAVFYGNQRQLEYDFVVAPGADPSRISLGITGATPSLDNEGNVLLRLADGNLALKKPVVYQNIAGGKRTVDARYAISRGKVRFQLGKYDHTQTLVIDPVFTYLTYLGGSSADQIGGNQVVNQTGSPAQALAIDSAGDVYVTGMTESTDFPVANAYQGASKTNQWTAFVSALNPSGTALIYSTYLGGSVYTAGDSVVWDAHDNALYVVGTTNSSDFPITAGAYQTILGPNEVGVNEVSDGQYNAFVAKFSPSGKLTNSTFLGGNYPTTGFGIATDTQGRAYVVGFTEYNCILPDSAAYSCFPTTPGAVIPASQTPPQNVSQNGNGFVTVFDPNLSTLLYSTLLGDPNGAETNTSEAFGVTVDPNGNFYVVGVTGSPSLPTTSGAYQPKIGTSNAIPLVGFAAKFGPVSASGAALTYLTYLEATGLSYGDLPGGVVADSQGNAYIGGYTNSTTFPITPGAYLNTCNGNNCVFVTKLNPNGTGLVWSTFVEVADYFGAIQRDALGNVYVTGHNSEFFQAVNALQSGPVNGGFVSKLDPTGSTLLFSSLVGNAAAGFPGNSSLSGLAVDPAGSIYVAGNMVGAGLPTTPGVVQPSYAGGSGAFGDGLIAKIELALTITTSSPLPAATVGTAYSQTLSAAAGTAPYAWSVTSGALPAGLTLAAGTGAISGTPTASGSFNFTVQAKDNTGATTSLPFVLTVNAVSTPLAIATVSPLISGYVNGAYSQTLVATGGALPYTWSVSGALPTGLTLSSTGAITGQPTTPGAFGFTVKVVDSNSATASQAFTLTIVSVSGSLARVGVLPQFAAGGSVATTIWVVNTSPSTAVPLSLVFHADNGTLTFPAPTPLTVTQQGVTQVLTTTTLDTVLNPNTTLVVNAGQNQAVNVEGWVDVLANASVSGFAIFTYAPDGLTPTGAGYFTPWEATVPLQSQLSASTMTLPFIDNGGFTTGIALGSLTGSPATITAKFYGLDGNPLPGSSTQTITLPANGHTAFLFNGPPDGENWSFTNGQQGIVEFSGSALMGLGLRVSPYSTETALPTILQ
jgi:hypothetical protein